MTTRMAAERQRTEQQSRPQRWTCWRCFRPIGEIIGTTVIIRRRGDEIRAQLPCEQTCPDCRTINRRDLEEGDEAKR